MELHLAGKTAIVTGGSAGIGLACAEALYAEGVNVVIAARDETRLTAAAQRIPQSKSLTTDPSLMVVAADMNVPEDIARVVETAVRSYGRIDILVNCAGAAVAGPFLDLPDAAFTDAWNLKLLGYIRMVRAVAPQMIAQGDGRIVNITGGAGRTPSPAFLAGSTANAALLNFTRGVSRELARHGVRINAISPGATATERNERLATQNAAARGMSISDYKEETMRAIPLGHLVDPAEIAAMTLLLVSDHTRSMTGTEVVIDGGQMPGV